MRLKADENLPESAVELLRDAGQDVHTVGEEGLSGSSDAVVLLAALREKRTLLTLDRGFGDIRSYPPDAYSGIVVLRAKDQTTGSIRALMTRVLPLLNPQSVVGKLWIVDERSVRVR